MEVAVVELQKQLAEEKDLEKDLMETLHKYKKIIVKRSQAPAAAPGADGKFLDCQDIDKIKITQPIAKGYSKVVQEGKLGDRHVAVKSSSYDVKHVKDCVDGKTYKKKEDCYILGTYQVSQHNVKHKQHEAVV